MRLTILAILAVVLAACAPKPDPRHPAELAGTWYKPGWKGYDYGRNVNVDQKDENYLELAADSTGTWHKAFEDVPVYWHVARDTSLGTVLFCVVPQQGIGGTACSPMRQVADTLSIPVFTEDNLLRAKTTK